MNDLALLSDSIRDTLIRLRDKRAFLGQHQNYYLQVKDQLFELNTRRQNMDNYDYDDDIEEKIVQSGLEFNDIIISTKSRIFVNVGYEYFVEKDKEEAIAFVDEKLKLISEAIVQFDNKIREAESTENNIRQLIAKGDVSEDDFENEEGLPTMEIREELDNEGNVISSSIRPTGNHKDEGKKDGLSDFEKNLKGKLLSKKEDESSEPEKRLKEEEEELLSKNAHQPSDFEKNLKGKLLPKKEEGEEEKRNSDSSPQIDMENIYTFEELVREMDEQDQLEDQLAEDEYLQSEDEEDEDGDSSIVPGSLARSAFMEQIRKLRRDRLPPPKSILKSQSNRGKPKKSVGFAETAAVHEVENLKDVNKNNFYDSLQLDDDGTVLSKREFDGDLFAKLIGAQGPEELHEKYTEEVETRNEQEIERIRSKKHISKFKLERGKRKEGHVSDVLEREEPVSDVLEREEPASDIIEREEPVSDIVEKEEPVSDIIEREEPVSDIIEREEPVSDIVEKEEPVSDVIERDSPVSDIIEREEPVSDIIEREEPVSDIVEREEPVSDIIEREEPVSDIIEREEPVSDIVEKEEPVSDVIERDSPVSDIIEREEPVSDIIEREGPVSDIVEREGPVSNIIEREEPVSDIIEREEPVSDIIERDTPVSDITQRQRHSPVFDAVPGSPSQRTKGNDAGPSQTRADKEHPFHHQKEFVQGKSFRSLCKPKQNTALKEKHRRRSDHKQQPPTDSPREIQNSITPSQTVITPKVDYRVLGNDLDDMAKAYTLGIYDDDLHDDPGVLLEKLEDFKSYNKQVQQLQDSVQEFQLSNSIQDQIDTDDQNTPLITDVVENDLPANYDDQNISDDDLSLHPDRLQESVAVEYRRLKDSLMQSRFAHDPSEEYKQIEPIDEQGNPIRQSRFRIQRFGFHP